MDKTQTLEKTGIWFLASGDGKDLYEGDCQAIWDFRTVQQ